MQSAYFIVVTHGNLGMFLKSSFSPWESFQRHRFRNANGYFKERLQFTLVLLV